MPRTQQPALTLVSERKIYPVLTNAPIGRLPNGIPVLCRGRMLDKRDVPLGFEFVENGQHYQTSLRRVRYSSVPADCRFRLRDAWFVRVNGECYDTRPNMPFGDADRQAKRLPAAPSDMVYLLEIETR